MNSLNEYIDKRNLFFGFKKALENRFACKEFLDKKIDDEEFLMYILEPARMSPSSFGMEPWRLLGIKKSKSSYNHFVGTKSRLLPVVIWW